MRLRFLDRLQVSDDRAHVGVLENELGCVVTGDEALAQSLLERYDGIAPAQGAEHRRFWVGTFAVRRVAWQRAQLRVTSVSPRLISAVPCADAIDPMQTDATPPTASPSAIILIYPAPTTQRDRNCRSRSKKPRHRGQGLNAHARGAWGTRRIRTFRDNDEGAEAFQLLALLTPRPPPPAMARTATTSRCGADHDRFPTTAAIPSRLSRPRHDPFRRTRVVRRRRT